MPAPAPRKPGVRRRRIVRILIGLALIVALSWFLIVDYLLISGPIRYGLWIGARGNLEFFFCLRTDTKSVESIAAYEPGSGTDSERWFRVSVGGRNFMKFGNVEDVRD